MPRESVINKAKPETVTNADVLLMLVKAFKVVISQNEEDIIKCRESISRYEGMINGIEADGYFVQTIESNVK